jgi:hypothetical protein
MYNEELFDRRIKKITGILFIVFCVGVICYTFFQDDQLMKNRTLLYGEVEDVSYLARSSNYFVTYHFSLNEELITAKSSIPYAGFRQILFVDSLLKGKSMPVIYQTDNPKNSTMLLTSYDYKRYKIEKPASVSNLIGQIDSLIKAYH